MEKKITASKIRFSLEAATFLPKFDMQSDLQNKLRTLGHFEGTCI